MRGNSHVRFLGGWKVATPSGYPVGEVMMKGFHHPGGSQTAFLTGLAHLYNLIPYQRRALHAGLCGVEVEGGRVPTSDWMLNLQILTSGGYQCAAETPHH